MAAKKLEDRVVALEAALDKRVVALEASLDRLTGILASFEPRLKSLEEEASRREGVVVGLDDKLAKLEEKFQVAQDSVEAYRASVREFEELRPKVDDVGSDGFEVVVGKGRRRQSKVSVSGSVVGAVEVRRGTPWAQRLRTSGERAVVIGDSLARGMGHKLRDQLGDIVDVRAVGGAKLGAVSRSVSELKEDSTRNLVVVAGANSLRDETTEDMLGNYRRIIESGKGSSKSLVVVGVVKRYDLGPMYERKRIDVNRFLKGICRESNVGFLEYQPERSRVHADGLHLNFRGQNELARGVFAHLKNSFLV